MPKIEPRRREVFVIVGLLFTLFCLRSTGFFALFATSELAYDDFSETPQVPLAPQEEKPAKTTIEPYHPSNYKVTWQNAATMPQSSLVSHVWGELLSSLCAVSSHAYSVAVCDQYCLLFVWWS